MRTLDGMTLRHKVAQMMMPWVLGDFAPEGSENHEKIRELVEEHGVGGVVMSVGSPMEVAGKLNDLQGHAELPLLVASDLESGAGFRFRGTVHAATNYDMGGATVFPSLMALGATGNPRFAYELGRITAVEARAMGVHVPFAPVLDVNNNPENPIINIRSFGEDPKRVAELGVAFVRGVQEHGAIATGKHFPGHGDTETDSHLALPIIAVERARMDSTELLPFQAAIDAGMRAVMTAHIAVPALTGDLPSTLSGEVLRHLLRDDMGFEGIVFTDALDMGAVTRRFPGGESAVQAVLAGADVLLMPPDVPEAIDAVVAAVDDGRLSEWRIDRSVEKILALKEEMGLHEERLVPLENVLRTVGIPDHTALADTVAERSLTVTRNGRNLLPLLGSWRARVLSVSFRPRNAVLAGRYFNERLRETYARLTPVTLDGQTNAAAYNGLSRQARISDLVVVSVYSNSAGRIELTDELVDFVGMLAERRIPHIVISFGNPYVIEDFPDAQAYMIAWSATGVSQRAAARALFGEFDIDGRTPTGVPPHFDIGDGLTIPAKETASGG